MLIHVLRATVMTECKCQVECWQCFCRVIDIGCMLRCFVCCVRVCSVVRAALAARQLLRLCRWMAGRSNVHRRWCCQHIRIIVLEQRSCTLGHVMSRSTVLVAVEIVSLAESSAGWSSVLESDLCWRLPLLIHVLRATVMTASKCQVECWQCFCRVIDIGCMLRCFVCCVRVCSVVRAALAGHLCLNLTCAGGCRC